MNDTARKIDLSVVIVYTNVAQLNEAVSYIEKQSIYPSVETVLLDNRENRFTSAASALNYGAEQARGEVVVFMHQDVYLWDERTLEKYYNFLIDKPNAIAGLAGVAKADGIIYYDICETKAGTYHKYSTKGEIMPALSVDECMFAMKRSLWEKLKSLVITGIFTARIFAFTILRTAAKTIFILRTAVTNPPATLSIRRSEKL